MKNPKASVLAMTLIILGMFVVVALSVSLTSIQSRKASIGESKSTLAYQVAETGVEKVMNAIIMESYANVGELCDSGILEGSSDGYTVTLKKANETEISCDVASDRSLAMLDIASVKSVGIGANQERRVIEAAVASITPVLYEAGSDIDCGIQHDNTWRDLCDLSITFNTTKSSIVQVFYNVAAGGVVEDAYAHLVTRIMLAQAGGGFNEVNGGRGLTGNTTYWSNDGVWAGSLSAGTYTIKIQYRTPSSGASGIYPTSWGWPTKKLKVLVF